MSEVGKLRIVVALNPSGSLNVMNLDPHAALDDVAIAGKLFKGDFIIPLGQKMGVEDQFGGSYDFVKVLTRVGIGMIPWFVLNKNTEIIDQPVQTVGTEYLLATMHTTLEQQKQQKEQTQETRELLKQVF